MPPTPRPRHLRRIEVRHTIGRRMATGDFSGLGGSTVYIVDGVEYRTPRAALDAARA